MLLDAVRTFPDSKEARADLDFFYKCRPELAQTQAEALKKPVKLKKKVAYGQGNYQVAMQKAAQKRRAEAYRKRKRTSNDYLQAPLGRLPAQKRRTT
jgi:hypothetical protein